MKITKKSFQSFFTRASFAGLLVVASTTLTQAAPAAKSEDEKSELREFRFDRLFAEIAKHPTLTTEGWLLRAPVVDDRIGSTASSAAGSHADWTSLLAAESRVEPQPSATLASGTLTPVATAYNYSTAPWVITSGTGTYPDGGGTATLNSVTAPTPGTLVASSTITIDVSPDLSQITYNSPFTIALAAGTSTSIIADPTNGLTLNAAVTAINSPTNTFTTFNTISSPISGGGALGVTKTGTGIITLTGANTYTGGTHINGGLLIIGGTAANGDAVLGATGAGNDIYFNGGTLFTNVTGGLTTARNIILGANGGTIEPDTAFTVNGVVSGAGSFSINAFGAVAVTLTNTNTYTGATITSLSTASALTLNGNGSIATSSSLDLSGTFTLDNSGTTGVNRIGDTAPVTTRGALITTTGNATTASAETFGALTLADGVSTINVVPGTAGSSLTTASITRANGATLFVRGTGLGATPGAGVSTILSTTAPTTVGGGGAAGTTMVSIVPYVLGNLTANTASTVAADINSGFVAYDPTAGFRPLATTEYDTTFGVAPLDNVRITASTAAPAGSAANALLFAPAATGQTISGGPILINSGGFIYSPTASGTIAGTVSAGLIFGTAEGVIQYTNTLTLSGTITGTGGLTIVTPSVSVATITGANTYTGTTTILAGQTLFTGAVANDGMTAGPFGLSTTPVVLNAGLGYALLAATANTTFARNLLVTSAPSPGLDYFGGASGLTMNGNIDMEHSLTIYAGTTTATGVVINGVISGPGTLQGFGTSTNVTLNGADTFTGGVNGQGEVYTLGTDTAFGTGTVFTSAATTFQGTAARTIANNFVTLANPTFAGTTSFTVSGTVFLDGARSIVVSDTAGAILSGVVSGGSLTKTNVGGPLSLNSTTGNTYTGGTVLAANVNALIVNNTSGSGTGTGGVSIGATSATVFSALAGNFTLSGATTIAGRLSPGNSGLTAATAGIGAIGTDNFGSTLTLSSATTSSLYLEVGASTSYDQINVTGLFTLNGTVFVATEGGYTIQAGDVYTVVNAGTLTQGTITFNTTGATLAPGVSLVETFSGTQLVISAVGASVPEPGTWAAVAGGIGMLGTMQLARRRRDRRG